MKLPMLDAGCWILDSGCWILDKTKNRYWIKKPMLDKNKKRHWILDKRGKE